MSKIFRLSGLFILFLVVNGFIVIHFVHSSTLPQNHQWQITLRDYLSAFEESDFGVNTDWGDFGTDFSYFDSWSDDEIFRLWTVFADGWRGVPRNWGLALESHWFLLDSIEREDGIYMNTGYGGPWHNHYSIDNLFWFLLDVPTNPFQGQIEITNRAMVSAIVDLTLLHDLHENDPNNIKTRSDHTGGFLARIAFTYWALQDILPQDIKDAYMEGMKDIVDFMVDRGPTNVNDNMDFKAALGCWYFHESVEEQDYKVKAIDYIKYLIDYTESRPAHPAGVTRDAGGIDVPYNGLALGYLTAAGAAVYNINGNHLIPELIENNRRFYEFRAHTIMSEPDGRNFGPSHFNKRTPDDGWFSRPRAFRREIEGSLQGIAFAWGIGSGRAGGDFPTRSDMISHIQNTIGQIMNDWNPLEDATDFDEGGPERWHDATHGHWIGYPPTTYHHYQDGWYQHIQDLINNAGEELLYAIERDNFIKRFPLDEIHDGVHEGDENSFLIAKFDNYYAIIYTGKLGWGGFSPMGGGSLSSFWTSETGAILHGRTGGPASSGEREEWQHSDRGWQLWPHHAVSGEDDNGKAFSTARLRRRAYTDLVYDINQDSAYVKVSGNIGTDYDGGRTVEEEGTLPNGAQFTREFFIGEGGLTVRSKIESNGQDGVSELYEIFPVWHRGRGQDVEEINLEIDFLVNDVWVEANTSFSEEVEKIRITRFGNPAYLVFTSPVKAKLSYKDWDRGVHRSDPQIRNILIDLLGDNTHMPTETSIEYTIKPAPKTPGGVGLVNPEPNADSLATAQTFQWEEAARTDTYQLQVSTQQNFSSTFYDNSSITETYHNVSGLSYNTQYYWRVRGLNEHGKGNWSDVRSFTTVVESIDMEIPVSGGWNLVSTYVNPGDPSFEYIFSGMTDNLVLVKDQSGAVYWPEYDVYDIDAWDPYSGYQVYVNESGMFVITGTLLAPESNPIQLSEGWNQIAYLRKTPMPVGEALADVYDKIDIVSNNAGDVFWPEYDINTLGDMVPGQGYKLHVSESAELIYPANSGESPGKIIAGETASYTTKQEAAEPVHYIVDFPNTGDYAILLLISSGFGDGDEIGVWSPENELVGSGVAHNGRALVTVWGKNPVWNGEDNNRGAVNGTVLRLTQWSAEEQREYPLPVSQVRDVSGISLTDPVIRYESDAVNIVQAEGLKDIPGRYTLEQNYPNPFNPATTIRYGIPEQSNVRLEVYNALGQRIKTLVDNEEQQPGYYQVIFNAANIASGVYFYRLQAGGYTEIKRMVLVR